MHEGLWLQPYPATTWLRDQPAPQARRDREWPGDFAAGRSNGVGPLPPR